MYTSPLGYRRIIGLAWPFILANAAVPLLGLVDTAVIGNLGAAQDLGAIAFEAVGDASDEASQVSAPR